MSWFYEPWGIDPADADRAVAALGNQGNDGRDLDYPGDLPANPRPLTEREERTVRKYSVMDAANERQADFREEKKREEKAKRVHNFLEENKSKSMPPPDSVDVITVKVVDAMKRENLGEFKFKRPWTTDRLLKEIKKKTDGNKKIYAKLGNQDIIGSLTPGNIVNDTISQELSEMKGLKGKTINAIVRGGKRRKTKRTRRRKRRRKTRKKKRSKKRRGKKRKTRKRRKKRR
jgi:hypothetical protein